MSSNRVKVIALAIGLDLLLGEPPERVHPVVGMGQLVDRIEKRAPRDGAARQLAYGGIMEAVCLAAATLPARLLDRYVPANSIQGLLVQALALKPTFAIRALFDYNRRVGRKLEAGELEQARDAVGEIVSRDVQQLDEGRVAAAAVESLAENSSDSVVAPILYYALFGLPGAYLYRMANTLDAMVGYRGKYEYLGKIAARVDDLLNLLPSRLTAIATTAGCWAAGGSPFRAWQSARRHASSTASPNSGWPMAAAAGALDLRLEKVDHYILNPEGRTPETRDLARARRVVGAGLVVALLGISLLAGKRGDGTES